MKVRTYGDFVASGSLTGVIICCPACDEILALDERWTWNGQQESATISPSVVTKGVVDGKPVVCHFNVTEGVVHFHEDCTHEFRGKTLKLPEVFSEDER